MVRHNHSLQRPEGISRIIVKRYVYVLLFPQRPYVHFLVEVVALTTL